MASEWQKQNMITNLYWAFICVGSSKCTAFLKNHYYCHFTNKKTQSIEKISLIHIYKAQRLKSPKSWNTYFHIQLKSGNISLSPSFFPSHSVCLCLSIPNNLRGMEFKRIPKSHFLIIIPSPYTVFVPLVTATLSNCINILLFTQLSMCHTFIS